jgi:uncharacterized protein (TIGR00297 family)
MDMMQIWVICALVLAMALSAATRKLTVAGSLTGGLVGWFIFLGGGLSGLLMLAVFFVAASLATGWKFEEKIAQGIAERRSGQRRAGQVLANGGAAAILGLLAWKFPQQALLFRFGMAGSISAAMADTISSELGVVYGRRFYNVVTFRRDKKGLDGVVSLEGTLLGIAGSSLIALLFDARFGGAWSAFIVIAAGFLGNLADSILGAVFERRQRLGNNAVNFLMSCFGALAAVALYFFLPH